MEKKQELDLTGKKYWDSVSADISGMLGGRTEINDEDLKNDLNAFNYMKTNKLMNFGSLMELCAGVGRETKAISTNFFDEVDIMDFVQKFLDEAVKYVNSPKLKNTYCADIRTFEYPKKYDCIWADWSFCMFENDELMFNFIEKTKKALLPGGAIIVKENILDEDFEDKFIIDNDDHMIIRKRSTWIQIFNQFNLKLIYETAYKREELCEIRIFCLKLY